ncbi:hypothetical protein [Vibrio hippocampi]|uniref:Outer membrane protein beta-barrel domain-containing protein n=1 Tax=Vibrio hippocampi TaxID=654686 RepID=A0ABN8DFX1_9VIBR|nr:hypothetical protein [Vibrio hippocampi]CAH0526299.1 hypothetical protein VHP8226_01731 [Vibrio hippocampi]
MNKLLVGLALLGGSAVSSHVSALEFAADDDLRQQVERDKNEAHWSGLPVWGDKVREMGYELPIPVGIGIYMNSQDVEYIANDDFKIAATNGLLGKAGDHCNIWQDCTTNYSIPKSDVDILGQDKSIQLRLDAWVFPFLNVYGLLGYTEGSKDIQVDLSNAEMEGDPFPITGVQFTLPLEYKAYNVGLGAVLAGQVEIAEGINPIIITAAGAITNSWTTTTDSTILTTIGAVRVGQRYDVPYGKLAVLLGYQYQSISQNVTGSIDLGVIAEELHFDVDLESKETSNMSVAMVYDFGYQKEWNIMAEYSFLNWDQLIVALGYRF